MGGFDGSAGDGGSAGVVVVAGGEAQDAGPQLAEAALAGDARRDEHIDVGSEAGVDREGALAAKLQRAGRAQGSTDEGLSSDIGEADVAGDDHFSAGLDGDSRRAGGVLKLRGPADVERAAGLDAVIARLHQESRSG